MNPPTIVFKSSRDLLEAELSLDASSAQRETIEPCRKPVRAAAKPRTAVDEDRAHS